MNGGRVTFGIWADDDRFQAWEASYFGLRSDSHYANASTGKTILARPYFDALSGNSPAKLLAAHPTFLSGDVRIDYSLQFQGAEVGISSRLVENAGNRFDLLLAYRYLDSDEQSRFESSLRYTTAQGAILAGTTKDIIDQFQT